MRRKKAIIELVGIVLVALLGLLYTFKAENKPLLGLDLQGGVSVVLKPKLQNGQPVPQENIDQSIIIMNNRINALGVAEPDIHQQGDTIVVQIAGVKDREKALDLVGGTAELRFRPVLAYLPPEVTPPGTTPGTTPGSTPPGSTPTVDPAAATGTPTSEGTPTTTGVVSPPSTVPAGGTQQNGLGIPLGESAAGAAGAQAPPSTVSEQSPPTTAATPPTSAVTSTPPAATPGQPTTTLDPQLQAQIQQAQAQQAASEPTTKPEDDLPDKTVILAGAPNTDAAGRRFQLGPAFATGAALESAAAGLDTQTGQWVVNPKFKPGAEGIDKFNKLATACYSKTAECPTGQMAITLDSEVISALGTKVPTFSADQIQISGSFNEDTARSLATSLKYGALPVFLERQSSQIVSASLGQDSLNAGLIAGAVGLLLVAIYMIAFYRLLGVLAICKLALEGAFLWTIISFLGSSAGLALTLAGVTGIIVSIGVSLDSNVVYYEHLREDIRNGRTVRSAVDRSFGSAIGTILKADGASLLGAVLLYWLAVGPVRGFAFFLALSTCLDLISSYLYMHPVVFLATGSGLCRNHPAWFGLPPGATQTAPPAHTRPSRRSGKATDDDAAADADDRGGRRRGRGRDDEPAEDAAGGSDASVDASEDEAGATTGAN